MLNQERQVNNMAKRTENRDFLMADFETSTQEWYEKDGYARVWLWGLYDPYNDMFNYGIDLDSFMENTLVFYKNKTPIIYFHNLKFDGSYIVNWLFRNGFAFDKDLSKAQTFTTAISDMGLWYYIDVCIYVKGKTKRTIRFQDSLKKIPLSVREMSSAFNLEYSKGDLDYIDR